MDENIESIGEGSEDLLAQAIKNRKSWQASEAVTAASPKSDVVKEIETLLTRIVQSKAGWKRVGSHPSWVEHVSGVHFLDEGVTLAFYFPRNNNAIFKIKMNSDLHVKMVKNVIKQIEADERSVRDAEFLETLKKVLPQ